MNFHMQNAACYVCKEEEISKLLAQEEGESGYLVLKSRGGAANLYSLNLDIRTTFLPWNVKLNPIILNAHTKPKLLARCDGACP